MLVAVAAIVAERVKTAKPFRVMGKML